MSNVKLLTIKKYNRKQAKDYALKYALKRNIKYFNYDNIGGNCTNFVSQCLFAGAPVMNYSKNGWYYISPSNTSVSWANVEPLHNFITTNSSVGIFGKVSPMQMCEIGDIIQLKFRGKSNFSHSLVITNVTGLADKNIFVCANTRDAKNVPLSNYSYEKIRLIHILGYRS